jgi:transcriptional regulator with XRE-family HTH domain
VPLAAPAIAGSRTGAPSAPTDISPIALRRFLFRLSQTGLAERAGLSRDTISRLERGEQPRLDTARAVSLALGVDVATLFPESEERQPGSADALQISGGQARHESG